VGSSRRTLPAAPTPAEHLPLDGCGDPRTGSQAPEDTPHKAGRYALLSGNLAEIRPAPELFPENDQLRATLRGQIGTSAVEQPYAESDKSVKGNITSTMKPGKEAPLARSVFDLRKSLGYTQQQLADALGIIQSRVANWESGKQKPPGPICARLSKLAPVENRAFWLKHAGLDDVQTRIEEEVGIRWIPLLRDPAAAGTPRVIDESEIQEMLDFPRSLMPPGGSIVAIKVTGDSMHPILEEGYTAFIDIASRNPEHLVGRMILAREGDGVTIKWFRKQEQMYLLVPENSSAHPIHVWESSDNRAIVGEVVCWIGHPRQIHHKRK
jgi:SOS-response transcriptional repressor LexA